jgi:hypothetical protein
MAAIARVLSRLSGTELEVETLKTIAIFCGVGLLVSLLFATYGLDLSVGFFWQYYHQFKNVRWRAAPIELATTWKTLPSEAALPELLL